MAQRALRSTAPGKRRGPGAVKARGRSREPPSPLAFPADPEPVAAHRLRRKCARRGPASAGRGPARGSSRTERPSLTRRVESPGRTARTPPVTSQRFHALLNSLFKVLFNFPLRYLLTIGLVPVFSLRWSLPPALGCIPKQPDSEKTGPRRDGGRYRPPHRPRAEPRSEGLRPPSDTGQAVFCTPHFPRPPVGRGFGAGLFPLRSPLLRESWLVSFPPLSNMLKFSGLSRLI
ncbi:hypothetical protein PAMP_025031 [Pampus punctatissimus]